MDKRRFNTTANARALTDKENRKTRTIQKKERCPAKTHLRPNWPACACCHSLYAAVGLAERQSSYPVDVVGALLNLCSHPFPEPPPRATPVLSGVPGSLKSTAPLVAQTSVKYLSAPNQVLVPALRHLWRQNSCRGDRPQNGCRYNSASPKRADCGNRSMRMASTDRGHLWHAMRQTPKCDDALRRKKAASAWL